MEESTILFNSQLFRRVKLLLLYSLSCPILLGSKNVTLDGARFQWSNYVLAKHMGDGPEGIQLPGYINPIEFFGKF